MLEILGVAGHASTNYVSPVKFGYVDLPNYPEYSPEKCQALLAEAGFPKGEGLPELEYITSVGFYPKTKEYGEVITAMLQEQGFQVTLSVLEIAAWNERLYDRQAAAPATWSIAAGRPARRSPTSCCVPISIRPRSASPASSTRRSTRRSTRSAAPRHSEERKKILQTETMPMLADKVPCPVAVHLGHDPRDGQVAGRPVHLPGRVDGRLEGHVRLMLPWLRAAPDTGVAGFRVSPMMSQRLRSRTVRTVRSDCCQEMKCSFLVFWFAGWRKASLIVFLVTLLIFTLLRVVPGDPVRLMPAAWRPRR